MLIYSLQAPDGNIYDLEAPEGATEQELTATLYSLKPEAAQPFVQESGVIAGAKKGIERLVSGTQTAFGVATGDANEAAKAALERNKAMDRQYADQVSLQKVQDVYNKDGLLSAAGEVASQAPLALAEQAPNFAASAAGLKLGAKTGAALGSIGGARGKALGSVIGGIGGLFAPSYTQALAGNVERQAQEQEKVDQPINIDTSKAALTAVPQAAADAVADRILLGGKLFGKLIGIPDKVLFKDGLEVAEKLAKERFLTTVAKGTATGIAGEVPTEVAQQALERYQAGLSLTSPEALREYGETMYQSALTGPIGAVGRFSTKSGAKDLVQQKEADEQPVAPPEEPVQPLDIAAQYQEAEKNKAALKAQIRKVEDGSVTETADRLHNKDIEEQIKAMNPELERLAAEYNQFQKTAPPPVAPTAEEAPEEAKPTRALTVGDSLDEPLGRFTKEELTSRSPKIAAYVDTQRKKLGKPALNDYSIEDLRDAMPGQIPEAEQADLNSLIAAKTGYTGQVSYKPEDVLNIAKQKNINTETVGFKYFLQRATGENDLSKMAQPQLYSAFKSLSDLPKYEETQNLPEKSSATHYSPDQYQKAVDKIKSLTTEGILPSSKALTEAKKVSGLKRDSDVQYLLQAAYRKGDLDLDSNGNFIAATPVPQAEFKVEEGFEPAEPTGFNVMRGDKVLFSSQNEAEAKAKAKTLGETAAPVIQQIEKSIASEQNTVNASQRKLDIMETNGLFGTPEYNKASAKHTALVEESTKKVDDFNKTKEYLQSGIEVKPKKKAANVKAFTTKEKGVSEKTFATREEALQHALENLGVPRLNEIAAQTKSPGLKNRIKKEIERRKNPKPFLATKPEPKAPEAPKETPLVTAQKESIKSNLLPMLKRFGLGNVALQIEDGMKAEGSYTASTIKVALDAKNPVRVLRHESLHGLKDLGFFTDGQWKVLENQADSVWIKKYLKDRNINGEPLEAGQQSRYEAYVDLYKGDMQAVREEAIADAFGDFDVNGAPKGVFTTLLNNMRKFFEALRNALNGAGYETSEDVFGKVERGELKATKEAGAAEKASLSDDAFKADKETIKAADKYEEENGIRPYVSEGFLDLPTDGIKYSLQKFNPEKHLAFDATLGLPINKNGLVTLYYHTTKDQAVKIGNKKVIPSEGRNRVYLTNESNGAGVLRQRGNFDQELDGSSVLVYVNPDMLQVDDTEYKDGRRDFYVPLAQGDYFNKKMKLQSIQKSRSSPITEVFSYTDHEEKITSAVKKYKDATPAERRKLVADSRKLLKQQHNIGSLLSENGKLEKTRLGDYDLDWEGNSVASMGLGLASAQQISEKVSTCPRSAICEGLCLGETSGGNFMFGGAASEDVGDIQKSSFRAAARMMQYLKTEALVINPEAFATVLQAEIDSLAKWSSSETQVKIDPETKKRTNVEKEIYQPAVRLNVTSDFKPTMFRAIIEENPDTMFYDYTKLGSETIAPNHHLTYSSTGFGQIVNGEKVFFKDKNGKYDHNWATMRDRRLNNGENVAMAFSSKSGIPEFLLDEETGVKYKVWNGDDYDARFLDPKQPDGKGMIIGLKNKAGTLSEKTATQKTGGFFVQYDPKTDGDTVVVPDQSQFKSKVIPIAKEKLSLREVKEIFNRAEKIQEPPGVEAIREQWIGGVSGIGDRDSMYDLYRVDGSKKYSQDVQDFIRKELGNDFKGYRLMSNEELEEIQTGAMGSQFASFTLNPDVARAFKNIPAYAKKTGMSVIEMDLTPEHVAMIGHPGELELVVDYGQGYNPDDIKVVEKYSLREFNADELPQKSKSYTLPANTLLFHGAHETRAKEIEGAGKVLIPRSPIKTSGGTLDEGGLIFFGDKETATDYANSERDPISVQAARDRGESRNPGVVFETATDRPYKLMNKNYKLTKKEANDLNKVLGIPDYKYLTEGDTADTAAYRAVTNSRTVDRYETNKGEMLVIWPKIFEQLGYDGFFDKFAVALTADNGIRLVGKDDRLERFSLREAPNTPEFKRFFSDSKIVDKDGKPVVLYHATNYRGEETPEQENVFTSFEESDDGKLGAGSYSSSLPKYSESYGPTGSVMPLYASIKNPFVVTMDASKMESDSKGYLNIGAKDSNKASTEVGKEALRILAKNPDFKKGKEPYLTGVEIKKLLQLGGYDGAVIKDNKGNFVEVAAFKPEQYKSATGNIGTYDPTNPDIRKSIRADVTGDIKKMSNGPAILAAINRTTQTRQEVGFIERITTALAPESFSYLRQKALDRYNRLSDVEKLVAKKMGGVERLADSNAHSAALQSDLAAGVAASALGVGDRIGGIPKYEKGYTTVSNEGGTIKGAVAIFAPLARLGDPKIYQAYQFWAASKRGKRLLANGKEELFTPQDFAYAKQLEQQYPEFVSVQKDWIKYNDGLVKYAVDTGVISAQNAAEFVRYSDYLPFYRQIEGERTIGPNIFQSISGVKAPKKITGSEAPLADFLETIVRNTQATIQAGMKNVAAQKAVEAGVMVGMVQKLDYASSAPNTITILEKGKKVSYECADKLWVDAVGSLNLPEIPFLSIFAKPADLLRNLVTKDPGFMLANLMRDSVSAYVTSGANITPLVSTMKEFTSVLMNNSPEYQKLLSAGALGGYEFSRDIESSTSEFAKDLRKKTGTKTTFEKATSPFTLFWGGLEKGTTASDAATRIAIYKATLKETGNEAEAIHRALEVMNFNRKGSSAFVRIAAATIPFLNARMQGLDVFFRSGIRPFFNKDATAMERQVQKAMFVRGSFILGMSAMYAAAIAGNPDYEAQEEETKDNNWIIPLGNGRPPLKIPIPFEVGTLFKTVPERIYRRFYGLDTNRDTSKAVVRALSNTFGVSPIPQIAAPYIEAKTNYSMFTQREIISGNMKDIAPEFQVGPSTTKTAEFIGKQTGLSPIMIDHVYRGYTGTIGSYASDLLDASISALSPEYANQKASKRFTQMPIVKRFFADPDARGKVTAFYDLKNSVDSAVRTVNFLDKTNNEGISGFAEKNATLYASRDLVNSLNKQMQNLQDQASMVRTAPIPPDQKREILLEISKAQNLLVNDIRAIRKIIQP
jgi:hypothetical protein